MSPMVLPLRTRLGEEGTAFGLVTLFPDGHVRLDLGSSWADAAARLAPGRGLVRCDTALATVGRRFGWQPAPPTETQLLQRAALAVALAERVSPVLHLALASFCRAWVTFFQLRLWEQVPAELCVRALRRGGGRRAEPPSTALTPTLSPAGRGREVHAIALMGQAGSEPGLAFYEDPRAFDAMWNGEAFAVDGLSVLAGTDRFLEAAFQPLGVPPPVVTHLAHAQAQAPKADDFALATAVMQLLINVTTGELAPVPLGPGATLELERAAPRSTVKPKRRRREPTE